MGRRRPKGHASPTVGSHESNLLKEGAAMLTLSRPRMQRAKSGDKDPIADASRGWKKCAPRGQPTVEIFTVFADDPAVQATVRQTPELE